MEKMTMFGAAWLAFAFLAAVVAQTKLSGRKAVRAQAPIVTELGTAGMASHGTPAYDRIPVNRPMSDEQTDRTANGGAPGPRYAWGEPVTT